MLYSIGYFDEDENGRSFGEVVEEFAGSLAEVYFPWRGLHTCRSDLDEYQASRLAEGLRAAKALGLGLCLLINANCYGGMSLSQTLAKQALKAIEDVKSECGGLDCVTTTSPFVAEIIKKYAPGIEVRASVNMRLGDWRQTSLMFDWFDSFYLMREHNYELEYIHELKRKLEAAGKGLHFLANSGCMAFCPAQTFHDNLVAHENEISKTEGVAGFMPYVCWRRYKRSENFYELLMNTWIRPEDVYRYEGLFSVMKLATRMHSHPTKVISAYVKGGLAGGNILELTEPSHAQLLFPGFLDANRLPADWFEVRSKCQRLCENCDYCKNAFKRAYRDLREA